MEPPLSPIHQAAGTPSLGEKLPRQEGDKSCPPTAEGKNEWAYTSTPSHDVIARTEITLPLHLPCYLKQNTLNLHSKDLSLNDV